MTPAVDPHLVGVDELGIRPRGDGRGEMPERIRRNGAGRIEEGDPLAAGRSEAAVEAGCRLVRAGRFRQPNVRPAGAARRQALDGQRGPAVDAATLARRGLEQRKTETLPSVQVLEAIARVLPDHTYVTEFRIENDTLRIGGFTRDAPALIQLIEQAPEFSRVTFYAPTTRAPADPGERYHIEARIDPRPGPPS
jgi:general secretion pathway protein L